MVGQDAERPPDCAGSPKACLVTLDPESAARTQGTATIRVTGIAHDHLRVHRLTSVDGEAPPPTRTTIRLRRGAGFVSTNNTRNGWAKPAIPPNSVNGSAAPRGRNRSSSTIASERRPPRRASDVSLFFAPYGTEHTP